MNNFGYITLLNARELSFKNTYTTGSLQSYSRPCIGYISKGMGKFLCNGNTYFAHEGDLVYIAKDTKYYSVWYGEPEIKFYSISFEFSQVYSFYDYRFQIVNSYPKDRLENIFALSSKSPLLAISHMYALLNDLYSKMSSEEVTVQSGAIESAIIHIENNYASPLEIDELCKICHMGRSTLFESFKKRTGVSPISYKHTVMIQHALDMLSHTDLTVDEISQKVGFSSSNYFRTVFAKLTGKKPTDLRRKEA
jgi:AraC-like DNA-binding protein